MPLPDALRDRYFLVNNHRAEHFYRAQPYPGSMAIFRAKGLYGDPYLGWADLVAGGFTVCDIPGHHVDHRSMMEEPAVKVLAGELRRELSGAGGSACPGGPDSLPRAEGAGA